MDEATQYWEKERDQYFKKLGVEKQNSTTLFLHLWKIQRSLGFPCEAKVNGIPCIKDGQPGVADLFVVAEKDGMVQNIGFNCIAHYARRFAYLLKQGELIVEQKHSVLPKWYDGWLKSRFVEIPK
jgi:hypothetical protein